MMPVAPARFSLGISSRSCLSSKITSTATHSLSDSRLTVGLFSAGRKLTTSASLFSGTFIFRPTFDRAAQEHGHVFHLLALPRRRPGLLVGDEARSARQQRIDHAKIIGADGRP